MNKKIILALLAAVVTMALSSCASKLKPMQQSMVNVEPKPMALVGNQVPVRIHFSFPPKYFAKGATLKVTPVIRYQGGSAVGESFYFQGENVRGNNTPINYAQGGLYTVESKFKFLPGMLRSELWLYLEGQHGSSKYLLPTLKVAEGVVATANLATVDAAQPAIAPDKFQRIIKQAYDANIMFLIQQANVRQGELNKEDVEEWRYIVQNAKEDLTQRVSVEVQAYASPDGKTTLNEQLSQQREKNTTAKLKDAFKKQDMADVEINAHYTAEDWEGFQKLVAASNLPDKDIVLRVLSMYPDPEQREREIRNISTVFSQLADEILPQLRRSRLIANVEIIGKSDDEIKRYAEKAPGRLTLEELLYSATLFDKYEQKRRMYGIARQLYSKDYRSYNNLGVLEFERGMFEQARYWFDQANAVKMNPASNLNIALLEMRAGNLERADQYLSTAGELPEFGQALGLYDLMQGKTTEAVKAFGDTKSNNAAVAQIVDGNYAAAGETLAAIANPDARTYYLKAVVGARTRNQADVMTNLGKAIEKDPALAKRAAGDLEFAAYAKNAAFQSLVK